MKPSRCASSKASAGKLLSILILRRGLSTQSPSKRTTTTSSSRSLPLRPQITEQSSNLSPTTASGRTTSPMERVSNISQKSWTSMGKFRTSAALTWASSRRDAVMVVAFGSPATVREGTDRLRNSVFPIGKQTRCTVLPSSRIPDTSTRTLSIPEASVRCLSQILVHHSQDLIRHAASVQLCKPSVDRGASRPWISLTQQ
mmetsp:Transcript_54530/g.116503  ORF Transcript_54530/g.116503 Transcript_54530/m.116503 type:complete len:200 (+) Transcript_54530:1671-2270(+)